MAATLSGTGPAAVPAGPTGAPRVGALGSHVGATSRKVPGMSTDTASSTGVETQVAALGTILSIWAHPDDETYLAADTTAAARAPGHRDRQTVRQGTRVSDRLHLEARTNNNKTKHIDDKHRQ